MIAFGSSKFKHLSGLWVNDPTKYALKAGSYFLLCIRLPHSLSVFCSGMNMLVEVGKPFAWGITTAIYFVC